MQVLLGRSGVGKSSLVLRYCEGMCVHASRSRWHFTAKHTHFKAGFSSVTKATGMLPIFSFLLCIYLIIFIHSSSSSSSFAFSRSILLYKAACGERQQTTAANMVRLFACVFAMSTPPTPPISARDTAGQERFRALAPMFYRGASAAVVTFDITDPQSFAGNRNKTKQTNKHSPTLIPAPHLSRRDQGLGE